MKNLKIGVKIAAGFGAVLTLVVIMSVMVLVGNLSIEHAVGSSETAGELQVMGKNVLSAYTFLKDNVTKIEILDDDKAYTEAASQLAECKDGIEEMLEFSNKYGSLTHFAASLTELEDAFAQWGKSIDELQASNKRLEGVIADTYRIGDMLSSRSRIVFNMQMSELSLEAGADLTALERIQSIGRITEGQKISDDIANSRRKLEVMLTNSDMTDFGETVNELEKTLLPIRQYAVNASSDADRSAARKLEALVTEYRDIILVYKDETLLSEKCVENERHFSAAVLGKLDEILDGLDLESASQTKATLSASQGSLMIVIASAVLALLLGVLIAVFIVRSVTKPIEMMVKAADTLAVGDVGVELKVDTNDEIGTLARAFEKMISGIHEQAAYMEKLSSGDMSFDVNIRSEKDVINLGFDKLCKDMTNVFAGLKGTASLAAETAGNIAQGSRDLADGTSQQASTIEQLSASLGDISKQTRDNSALASRAAGLGGKIKQDAEGGSEKMERMVGAVADIAQASKSIGGVIKIIDDIAFQTNILALNAAVEAARAGQHGKGFAVVAEEVRNLASKSAEAAKDTGELIENSIEKAELGAGIANETSDSLRQIVAGIMESTQIVETIAKSGKTQAESVEQINQGINLVSGVVQRNTSTSEQSAAAAEKMREQSQELNRLISEFRLRS